MKMKQFYQDLIILKNIFKDKVRFNSWKNVR